VRYIARNSIENDLGINVNFFHLNCLASEVRLKNVRWTPTIHNPGYTVSLIGGWDADHRVEGVVFEDFYVGDKKATGPDDLDLHTRHASGIEFR
jgi:hypothetical protein